MPENDEEKEVMIEIPETLLEKLDLLISLKKDKYPDRSKAILEAIKQLVEEDKDLLDRLRKKKD